METFLIQVLVGLVSFFGVAFLTLGIYYMKRRDRKQDELTAAVQQLEIATTEISGWMKDIDRRVTAIEGEESEL